MKMFGLVVASFIAILCLNPVAADGHECVNATNTIAVNNLITELQQLFAPILASSDAENVKVRKILQSLCNTTKADGANKKTKDIQELIAGCPGLITESNLKTIDLYGLTFTDMFARFSSVDNFCACSPTLMQAMALNSMKTALMDNTADIKYPFINVSALCSRNDIKMAVSKIADDLATCQNVWKYTDFLTATNTKLMKKFIDDECSQLDSTSFSCAVDYSKKDSFKNCIMDAEKTTGDSNTDEDKMCERRECAVKSECKEGSEWYMMAVNMKMGSEGTFSKEECNGVSSAVASVSVFVVALFTAFLY